LAAVAAAARPPPPLPTTITSKSLAEVIAPVKTLAVTRRVIVLTAY
jgi:hypothetical protein